MRITKIYNMSESERRETGRMGRMHVLNNYGFTQYVEMWDKTLTELHEEQGSWENRKNYKSWELMEIA